MTEEAFLDRPRALRLPSLTALLIVVNLAIVLPLAAVLNIAHDEAYTMHTTSRGIAYAFTQAIVFEQNAPFYFVVLNLWRHVNDSLIFARAFSILSIAASLALVPRLVKQYLPGINPGMVTVALALNPFTIAIAAEARVYALTVLEAALLLLTFFGAFLNPEARRSWPARLAYAAVVVIAVYSQYYFVFLVAAQGVMLFVYARRRAASYLVTMGFAILALLPLAAYLPGQVSNFHGGLEAPHTLLASIVANVELVAEYVLPMPLLGHTVSLAYAAIAAVFMLVFVVARRSLSFQGRPLVALIAILGLLLLSVAIYVEHVSVLDERAHAFFPDLAPFFLPAILSTFALATFAREPARSRLTLAWVGVTTALSCAALLQAYAPLANPGDWARVSAYLQSHESKNEPIVVFIAEGALPLEFYYRGLNSIVPVPQPINFERWDPEQFVVRDELQLSRAFPRAARLWIVTSPTCGNGPTVHFGCKVVERYVARHYRVVSSAAFYHSTVELLSRG